MSPTPGVPDRFQRAAQPRVEVETTPVSVPPGTVRIGGHGWKLQLPVAIVLALGSAIGARLLPTQTSTDVSVERAAVAAERNALEQERGREELRRQFGALNDRLDRLETRISALEAVKQKP